MKLYLSIGALVIGLTAFLYGVMWYGEHSNCKYFGYQGATQDYGRIHCAGDGYPIAPKKK